MARRTRYKFGPPWQKEYLKHNPPSFLAEDFDARSALYILLVLTLPDETNL